MTNTTPTDLQAWQWYFDCGQCGEVGRVEDLREHPTRPVADDMGFCPGCGCEVDEYHDEQAIRQRLAEYDDDVDEVMARIKANRA